MSTTFVAFLLVFLTAFQNGYSGSPAATATAYGTKVEKTLFVPSVANYPNLFHLHPTSYGSGAFDNAAYPRYVPNRGYYEYADSLQRQPLYPNMEKRLEDILHMNEKKYTDNIETDEDEYKRKANNVLYFEQTKPESADLDRRYKRSTTYVSWSPPMSKTNNLENRASAFNSRAVNVPFGPYTTWSPLKIASSAENSRTRRHNYPEAAPPPPPPSSSSNELINTFDVAQPDLYRIVSARHIPLQYSVVYEPVYPVNRKASDNLPNLRNSLTANAAQPDALNQLGNENWA